MSDAGRVIDPDAPPSGTGCADCLTGDGPGWWFHRRGRAARGRVGRCDSSPSAPAIAHPDDQPVLGPAGAVPPDWRAHLP